MNTARLPSIALLILFIMTGYGFSTLIEKEGQTVSLIRTIPTSLLNCGAAMEIYPIQQNREITTKKLMGPIPPFVGNSYTAFKEAVAYMESSGRYHCINSLGYLGKFQFGKGTLKILGINDTILFLNHPALQEVVFDANVARNKWLLRKDIKRFVGTVIKGVKITESGMLAAAHLAGAGNVKKFVRTDGNWQVADAYGTTLQQYLTRFSDYEMGAVLPLQRPKIRLMEVFKN